MLSAGVQQRTDSSKSGRLLLQLDWKDENKQDLHLLLSLRLPHLLRSTGSSQHDRHSPAGSKYAVARVSAANGKIWVDDYSLKKIPKDCEPVLFVTPNPVSAAAEQPGRAAISWNACCSAEGRITMSAWMVAPSSFSLPDNLVSSFSMGLNRARVMNFDFTQKRQHRQKLQV
jgi:hypothetical protein